MGEGRLVCSPRGSCRHVPNSRERRVIIPYKDQTLRPPHYLTPRVEKKDGCTSGGPFLWQSSGEGGMDARGAQGPAPGECLISEERTRRGEREHRTHLTCRAQG